MHYLSFCRISFLETQLLHLRYLERKSSFPALPSCKHGAVHSFPYHRHMELFLGSILQIQNKSSGEDANQLLNVCKDHRIRCSAMKGSDIRKPTATHTSVLFVSSEQNQL